MAIIQIFEDEENGCISCNTKTNHDYERERGFLSKKAVLIHEYYASTWLEAMQKRNNLMGWGEYYPSLLDDGEIDPFYLEDLDDDGRISNDNDGERWTMMEKDE